MEMRNRAFAISLVWKSLLPSLVFFGALARCRLGELRMDHCQVWQISSLQFLQWTRHISACLFHHLPFLCGISSFLASLSRFEFPPLFPHKKNQLPRQLQRKKCCSPVRLFADLQPFHLVAPTFQLCRRDIYHLLQHCGLPKSTYPFSIYVDKVQ